MATPDILAKGGGANPAVDLGAGLAGYYPVAVLALVVIAFLGLLAFCFGRLFGTRTGAEPGSRADRDAADRWAGAGDVKHLVVGTEELVDRPVLGRIGKKRVAMPALASLAVIAPTGMGKTARFVVPTVLGWQGAAVVTSVKGDAVALTIDQRRRQGPVWVFDPTGASGYETCTWCPLKTAETYAGALKAAAWLCDSSRVEKLTSNEQQLWDTLGQQLMAPVLFAAAHVSGTMATVVDWILFEQEARVEAILEEIGDRTALGHWRSINRNPERTKKSIYMTAQKIMHVFGHPAMTDALTPAEGEPGFNPDELLEVGGTLYVVAPAEDQDLFTPVFESLVNAVVRAAEKRSMANRGLPLDPRLLLMLDEAANCAPLRQLPRVASTGRGMGIVTVSVWQDESQIETIYGAVAARTVLANHTGRLMLPGCTDVTTLKHMSELLGPRSVQRSGESVGADGRVSTSRSWQTEALAPVDYIRELEADEALAVVGREKPMRLHTTAWFEDDRLRARIDPDVVAAYDAAFAVPPRRKRRHWDKVA